MSNHRSWASNVGVEEGVEQRGSAIVAPSGEVQAFNSAPADELVAYHHDVDETTPCLAGVFNVAQHRRNEHYGGDRRAIGGRAARVRRERTGSRFDDKTRDEIANEFWCRRQGRPA